MKSDLLLNKIYLDDINHRLIAFVRLRINGGEYTERSLARMLGISQPHLHNMLKGARRLSSDFAGIVMVQFGITILDLITREEIWSHLDEQDPEWIALASKRKPAGSSDIRSSWRTPKNGT